MDFLDWPAAKVLSELVMDALLSTPQSVYKTETCFVDPLGVNAVVAV